MSVEMKPNDPRYEALVHAIMGLVPPRQHVDIPAVLDNLHDMLNERNYAAGQQVFADLLWSQRQFERRHDHMTALAEWLWDNVASFDCLQDAAESLAERARVATEHEEMDPN